MIAYNMRYKGPLEYDKFILNILQFATEVNYIKDIELQEDEEYISILTMHKQITEYLSEISGTNSVSSKCYIKSLLNMEAQQ